MFRSLLSRVPRSNHLASAAIAYSQRYNTFLSKKLCTLVASRGMYHMASSNVGVKSAGLAFNPGRLLVDWSDSSESEYPFTWLRDNCQCPACFHPVSLARLSTMPDYNPASRVVKVDTIGSDEVALDWCDGHHSVYKAEWLKERCFSPEARSQWRRGVYQPARELWDHQHTIAQFDFNEVLTRGEVMYQWLYELRKHGLCLLKDAPCEAGVLAKLVDKISYPRVTNYDYTFDVVSNDEPTNLAYTSGRLDLHTDLPVYRLEPGIQMLHCIQQTADMSGGDNEFSDGIYAANVVKQRHPEAFEILCTTLVDYYDWMSTDFTSVYLANKKTMIQLDHNGEIDILNYNNNTRNYRLDLPIEEVEGFYRSLKILNDVLNSRECVIDYRLKNGDIVSFDNTRVLHGRSEYQSKGGRRFLQGIYVEWDETFSRMRRLRETL